MKLVYSIPDKLYYIQNFLDYSTYKKLHYDFFKKNLIKLNSAKKNWNKGLKYGFKNFVDFASLDNNYLPLQKIKILLENNPFHTIKIKNYNPMLHSMKNNSGINWHDDGTYSYGITFYINRRWNLKFGGEFLFTDKKSNGFIPLVGNSLIIAKTPLWHKVTPIMKPIVPRKTIQIFIEKEKKNERKNS